MSGRHIIANPNHASAQERYDRLKKFLSEVLPKEEYENALRQARELVKLSRADRNPLFCTSIALAHFELESRCERDRAWNESTLATLGFT